MMPLISFLCFNYYRMLSVSSVECEVCLNTYDYKLSNSHTRTRCSSCIKFLKRNDMKNKAISYMGGKCKICAYDKCTSALVFHHIKDKNFTISEKYYFSWDQIQKELDLCVLLCSRCHAEIHARVTELPA